MNVRNIEKPSLITIFRKCMTRHTGEKLYKSAECGKGFNYSISYQKYKRTHWIKPLECKQWEMLELTHIFTYENSHVRQIEMLVT